MQPRTAAGSGQQSTAQRSLWRTAVAAWTLLRPRQWTKNLLVLAAPLFAAELTRPDVLARTILATVAFCLVSSAGYVYNDLHDAELDRAHPLKRSRPIAAGEVKPRAAMAIALVLAVAAFAVGYFAAPWVAALVLIYAVLMLFYSNWGRAQAPLDVFIIAIGFVLRAIAGAAASHVPMSPWFLALTLLLAVMLGFGKRRAELSLLGEDFGMARNSLRVYSVAMLDQLLSVLAASIIVLYAIYAVSISGRLNSSDMILTWPLVLVGVLRYLQISHTADRPPDELLVSDRVILVLVVGFAGIAAVVLHYHTHILQPITI
ncbi:MAG: decaprenyl-phosphate phosphoribosyltransferase [Candidatus Dormibacteraeota bacterium]|nr:decaprenyl-phosphate phosphoribosyltransferase [Candidatus Dormibacteraeota bacterium]